MEFASLRHVCDQHERLLLDWIDRHLAGEDDREPVLALLYSHRVYRSVHNVFNV